MLRTTPVLGYRGGVHLLVTALLGCRPDPGSPSTSTTLPAGTFAEIAEALGYGRIARDRAVPQLLEGLAAPTEPELIDAAGLPGPNQARHLARQLAAQLWTEDAQPVAG